MITIFIKTEYDLLCYDLVPGADIQALLPLLVEDLGESEDRIQLFLHGNRLYPGTSFIHAQTYELVIVSVEHILLYAKQLSQDWHIEQISLDSASSESLTRYGSRGYQIRHSEELRYQYDVPSFVSVMKSHDDSNPTNAEVDQFVMDHVEFLPGDYVRPHCSITHT